MKRLALLASVLAAGGAFAQADVKLAELERAELRNAVRPGKPDGSGFWNRNAQWFMYPPAFNFDEVKGAKLYRFTVLDDWQHAHVFYADSPKAPLTPVWEEIRTGFFTVLCDGMDARTNFVGAVCDGDAPVRPSYWKLAAFKPGAYGPAKRGYAEAAKKIYDFVFEKPSTRHFLETGKPDPDYVLNCYPSKIHSSLIEAMVRYAKLRPDRAADALKLARNAADYLLSLREPADAPLAHFTPTYDPHPQYRKWCAEKYAGQTMLLYPASAGQAFLSLAERTGEAKYKDAALKIADTYLKLQGADGTWCLKLWLKDGKPVNENRCFPLAVAEFLERAYAASGNAAYRAAADRAAAYVDRGPMADFNWEGQFEDVEPTKKYVNLTKHPAVSAAIYFLKRHPGDAKRKAEARELLRFAEDQFVLWERPCRADGTGIRTGRPWYRPEDVTVDYLGWYVFPSATEQYHWNIPIDASNAKLIRGWLATWKATGNPLDLAKARAFGDALTRAQLDSGRIPTQMAEYNLKDAGGDWVNCILAAARALELLAECEQAEGRTP